MAVNQNFDGPLVSAAPPTVDPNAAALLAMAGAARFFDGTSGQLSAADEMRAWMLLSQDPGFIAIENAPPPAGSVPLKNNALNDYAFNNPASPLYGLNLRPQALHNGGAYRVVTDATGTATGVQWVPLGDQHWFTDVGIVGPLVVAAADAATIAGAFGGGASSAIDASSGTVPGITAADIPGGTSLIDGIDGIVPGISAADIPAAIGGGSIVPTVIGATTAVPAIIKAVSPTTPPRTTSTTPTTPATIAGLSLTSNTWVALAIVAAAFLFERKSHRS